MKEYFKSRWRWVASTPKELIVVIAVSITWGMWLSHVVGSYKERRIWEQYRSQMQQQMCVPIPKPREGGA